MGYLGWNGTTFANNTPQKEKHHSVRLHPSATPLICITAFMALVPAFSQEIQPLGARPRKAKQNQNLNLLLPPVTECTYRNGWLPLKESTPECAEAYYNANNWIAPLSQVKFLYGSDSKSLSADLASVVIPLANFQLSVGTSVTSTTSDTTATGSNSSTGSTSSSAVTQAIEHLKAGGDFYLKGAYPLLVKEDKKNSYWFAGLFATPKIGFNVQNFGAQSTITEGTEVNGNLSMEAYSQLGVPGKGFVYADIRGGGQFVQHDFAQAVGLNDQTKFGFGQAAFGVQFGSILRVGGEAYFGPVQAFNLSSTSSRWHLVVQVAPPKNQK